MTSRHLIRMLGAFLLMLALSAIANAQSLPQVSLNADNLGPRSIEQLTGTNITREYAMAWLSLAQAMDQNRADLLKDGFTGFAHDRLSQRIADQQSIGLRTQIVDHGHRVKAVFYSQDGGAMQLIDEAHIEVQVFDGSRLIDSNDKTRRYVVLMTPGADRWYVRNIEEDPAAMP